MKYLSFLFLLFFFYNCVADEEGGTGKTKEILQSNPSTPQKEYTREVPGEWKEIADDHLPKIEIDQNKSKKNVKIFVPGKTFSERHYIEAIGLMDERSRDIELQYFKRGDTPVANLTLDKKKYEINKIKVFVKCNLHDLWTSPILNSWMNNKPGDL
ncbi:MAG: hypothetical protein KDK36_11335 [Leptospiraceae bacterium]|nr:hypothetical protein [Leptospiraceae bacterium]